MIINILKFSRRKIDYNGSQIYIYRERKSDKLYFRAMSGKLAPICDPKTGFHLTHKEMLKNSL